MANFKDQYIDEISKVNPSTNVTDENYNLSISELENNLKFITNMVAGSSSNSSNFLSQIFGNLLDYDRNGNKILHNGGNFDCFEKKNSWISLNKGQVTNGVDIQTEPGAENLLIYRGGKSYIDVDTSEVGIWIERDFLIPPSLRGSELVFAVKGTGVYTGSDKIVSSSYVIPYCNATPYPYCDGSILPSISGLGTCSPSLSAGTARYEDIGIEVIGATTTVQETKTVGPWPNHVFYAEEPTTMPGYRTAAISFKVGKNTELIKIKIRRTRNDGVLALSQIFLGALPMPFEKYNIKNLDINELFDFNRAITKFNSSSVNGRHVASVAETSKLSNLLTKEQAFQLSQFNKTIENFTLDSVSPPSITPLSFTTMNGSLTDASRLNVYSFSPQATQKMNFKIHVDGPNPGVGYLGVSFFVNKNASYSLSCPTSANPDSICGYARFKVLTKVINMKDYGNPIDSAYTTYCYNIPVYGYMFSGKMGYFELYGNFFSDLTTRGSLVYFNVMRDGSNEDAILGAGNSFDGNILIGSIKVGLAVPPDDITTPGNYANLFVGNNSDC